jgi:L-ascorbate metabolism protein UlaG (beta-lactamase superfamily)
LCLLFAAGSASAQTQTPEYGCPIGIASTPSLLRHVAWDKTVPIGQLRLSFRGHATFSIETPGGASAATDYNGITRPPYIPDAVTMNNAHPNHYADYIEPEISHVLRGWDPEGGVAKHEVAFKDMTIFSIPTNLFRRPNGQLYNGNSIFVFKAADLCVAHLGHLHQILSDEQRRALRRVDVLMINIDGNTMTQGEALKVIEQVSPRLVIPMHYLFQGLAERFARLAAPLYPVRVHSDSTIVVDEASLPHSTEILFLQPAQ